MQSSNARIFSHQIIGRQPEREQLLGLLDQAIDGQGALALVSGTAGIGKTTLVNDIMQTARDRNVLVFAGGSYPLTSTPPFGLWAEALRSHEPRDGMPCPPPWIDALDPDEKLDSQRALHDDLRRFLVEAAAIQPMLVILEDLHWGDPASLDALRYVARQHHIPPVLIVGTLRNDEIAPNHPLYEMLPLLVRETGATRIELQTFGRDEIQSLVRSRYQFDSMDEARLVDDLLQRTAGNPFFLSEVLRLLEAERLIEKGEAGWPLGDLSGILVPPLVRQVIEGWLSKLDDEDRRLLEIAAVIGQDLSPDVWESAINVDASRMAVAIDRALDAGLLIQHSETLQVSFTHALVRETLYQRLPLSRRQALHGNVAEIIENQPGISPDVVASHYAQANDPRAVDWLIRSGRRAHALYAARDAAGAFSRAHDLAVRFSACLPTDAYRMRASAFMMLGEFDPARRDFELVLERARESGYRMLEWQILIDLALLWAERDYDLSGRYCRVALDLARDIGDRPAIARSLNRIANWYVNVDDQERALSLHREALAILEDVQDRRGVADTLDFIGMASYLNRDYPASTEHYERAVGLFRDLGERQRLSTCLAMLALNGGDLDVMAAPVYRESAYWTRSGEEALEIARDIGWPAGEAFALIMLSMAIAARGEFQRSLDRAREGLEIAERIDHREWTVMARYSLGRTLIELHQTESAESHLELALALARQTGWELGTILASGTLVFLYALVGDASKGKAVLDTLSKPSDGSQSMGAYQRWHAEARLHLATGNVDASFRFLERIARSESQSADVNTPGISPLFLKLRGDVLARAGRVDEAEAAYQSAEERARLHGFYPLLWRINAAMGNLFREHDRTREADAAHQAARSAIQELAEKLDDEELRETFRMQSVALLDSRADTPSRDSSIGIGALTPREREVLRHIVEGKTDREIGDDLYISPRTVMRHVSSILSKLDVASRTAAATLAVRRDLV